MYASEHNPNSELWAESTERKHGVGNTHPSLVLCQNKMNPMFFNFLFSWLQPICSPNVFQIYLPRSFYGWMDRLLRHILQIKSINWSWLRPQTKLDSTSFLQLPIIHSDLHRTWLHHASNVFFQSMLRSTTMHGQTFRKETSRRFSMLGTTLPACFSIKTLLNLMKDTSSCFTIKALLNQHTSTFYERQFVFVSPSFHGGQP